MEGDVSSILPRPTLPPQSPNPKDSSNQANNSVHRYASRDLRTREAQAEIEKWDAWHACAGMSRTEAKRRYITTLIETMKEYASGTSESRELVAELEFVWNQIRSQSGSDESEEGESPTRRLERAGMKQTGMLGRGDDGGGGGGSTRSLGENGRSGVMETSIFSRLDSSGSRGGHDSGVIVDPSRDQTRSRNQGLRVLSPTSQRGSDDIVENEELAEAIPEPDDDEEYASASEDPSAKPKSKSIPIPSPPASPSPHSHSHPPPGGTDTWRTQIESHLRHLTTELAALREQLSSHNLLSRSSFSIPLPSHLSLRKRVFLRISLWLRWLFWASVRQAVIQLGILAVVLVWGRIRGDRTVETWVRDRISEFWSWARFVARGVRDRDGNLVRGLAVGRVRVS